MTDTGGGHPRSALVCFSEELPSTSRQENGEIREREEISELFKSRNRCSNGVQAQKAILPIDELVGGVRGAKTRALTYSVARTGRRTSPLGSRTSPACTPPASSGRGSTNSARQGETGITSDAFLLKGAMAGVLGNANAGSFT